MKKLLLCLIVVAGCKSDHAAAKRAAEEFAQNIPDATNVTCAKADTDSDGYCACTVFRGSNPPLAIECGCERFCVNCAEGCKVVETLKVRDRR